MTMFTSLVSTMSLLAVAAVLVHGEAKCPEVTQLLQANFNVSEHLGQFFIYQSTAEEGLSCAATTFSEIEPNKIINVTFKAFRKSSNQMIDLSAKLTAKDNPAVLTLEWIDSDNQTKSRDVNVLSSDYNSTLLYSCNVNNETLDQYAAIVIRDVKTVDDNRLGQLKEVLTNSTITELQELAKELKAFDVDTCSGAVATTLKLSLALMAVFLLLDKWL